MNVIWLDRRSGAEPLAYRVFASQWGEAFALWHGDTLCRLAFLDSDAERQQYLEQAGAFWACTPEPVEEGDRRVQALEQTLHAWPHSGDRPTPTLEVIGTRFQQEVWRSLLRTSPGQTFTYKQIARRLGNPSAAQAVGRAVGANPVALLIPCHRVLPASGGYGGYRWGVSRKKRILEAEGA